MKSTKIAAISLLIAAALLFLLAGFMPFATLDDKQSDTEETTQLEDMTFYIMNSLTTRSLGTVLSTGMFTILLLISIGSVFLALSDKTKKFVLLCISVFAALTIYSLTAMAASYNWFELHTDGVTRYSYSPSGGCALLIMSLLCSFAAAVCYAAGALASKTGSGRNMNALDELVKWKNMLDNGAISQEEYDEKKQLLLSGKKPSAKETKRRKAIAKLDSMVKSGVISQEEYELKLKDL